MHKNEKTSFVTWNVNFFFFNCSVMLWKKTEVLCKRHVTTWCISMLRNSKWDKLKWHLYLRWQLHIKLISIISPHSENTALWFYLDCSIFGWNKRDTTFPEPGCTGTELSQLLPSPPRASEAQHSAGHTQQMNTDENRLKIHQV